MFVNLTSILLPIIIFQTNLICSCVLIAFVSYESVIGHTPFIGKISRHHLHHKYFNVNFDNFPYVFDKWVLNTYPLEPYGPYLCHKHLTNLTIKIVYS